MRLWLHVCSQLEMLLDEGVDVNSKDENGNTLLIVASQNGLKRISKLLLRRGAGMNDTVSLWLDLALCCFASHALGFVVLFLHLFLVLFLACLLPIPPPAFCRISAETPRFTTRMRTSSKPWEIICWRRVRTTPLPMRRA